MLQIAAEARKQGHEVYTCCPKSRSNLKKKVDHQILIGNIFSRNLHIKLAKLTGYNGCFSILSTWNYLRKIKKISPDLIHLHNLHNCYINLPMLFRFIKKYNIRIIWTLHDCWSFTGQCPYFTLAKCEKWKIGCYECQSYREYPSSRVDKTQKMWKLKKKWFTGINNMTIVTPSQWLADLVKQSFLKDYPVQVINNGIDLEIFKPISSDFRQRYNISESQYVLLGVAFDWGKRKGLDIFVELSKRLDDKQYKIVLVGTDDSVDKILPKNIISIHRTQNQNELAEIYSAADLFVNPTREENYPTVNMESIACGTPVLTFRTGGSSEILDDKTGYVVDADDIDDLEKQIVCICTKQAFSEDDCLERAMKFANNIKFQEYINLYK